MKTKAPNFRKVSAQCCATCVFLKREMYDTYAGVKYYHHECSKYGFSFQDEDRDKDKYRYVCDSYEGEVVS